MMLVKKLYTCQKAVRICKERTSQGPYDPRFSAFKEDVFAAMRDLKPSAFQLYMYLLMNQDGYCGGLNKVDVMNNTNMGDGSYANAVKELINKNYLVYANDYAQSEDNIRAPLYNFHSRPVAKFD